MCYYCMAINITNVYLYSCSVTHQYREKFKRTMTFGQSPSHLLYYNSSGSHNFQMLCAILGLCNRHLLQIYRWNIAYHCWQYLHHSQITQQGPIIKEDSSFYMFTLGRTSKNKQYKITLISMLLIISLYKGKLKCIMLPNSQFIKCLSKENMNTTEKQ